MPTPFNNPTSHIQHRPGGEQMLFPSEQPRLHPAHNIGPVTAHPSSETQVPEALPTNHDVDVNSHVMHDPMMSIGGLDGIDKRAAMSSLGFPVYQSSLSSASALAYDTNELSYTPSGIGHAQYNPSQSVLTENVPNGLMSFYDSADHGEPGLPVDAKMMSGVDSLYLGGGELHLPQQSMAQPAPIQTSPHLGDESARSRDPPKLDLVTIVSNQTPKNTPPPLSNDAHSPNIPAGTRSQHGTWKRGNKGRTPLSVKRSQSTPNVQLAAQLAAASAASAPPVPTASTTDDISPVALAYQLDKKRNKLGYHRTSVACGHCRRRKIRCILAKDESGRCSNCIRLKKECSFYPVESSDRRPRSASKPEISSHIFQDNCSSPSSPTRSPRLGTDPTNIVPTHEGSIYPSSLPITPNYDSETPLSLFDEPYRNRSLSSSSRASLAFSNAGSRRPSLAHMFTAPLPSREFRSLSDASPTYTEPFSTFASRYGGSSKPIGIGIEDPTSSFWRLENASSSFSPLSQQINFGGMPPVDEDAIKHERLNSVDNSVGPMAQSFADSEAFPVTSDQSLGDPYFDNTKSIIGTHQEVVFHGEEQNSFSEPLGYGFPWNEGTRNGDGNSHGSSLTEHWLLPQQQLVSTSREENTLVHHPNANPLVMKYQ